MIRGWLSGVLVVVLAAGLVGCDRGQRDLERWVADVKARSPEPIEPIPPIRSPETVVYTAHEERDPFRVIRRERDERPEERDPDEELVDGPQPDFDRRQEYLEEFPLDTLAMVGTLTLEGIDFALVRDTEGVIHRVREGNYLGQNHGEVVQVTANRIVINELIPEGPGWRERNAEIALAER